MPIITMSSASFKFYLLSLIFICALSWSTAMPVKMQGVKCRLTSEEYNQLPAVSDERLADAEMDSAYEICKFRQRMWT